MRPATIPPTARATPPKLARSGPLPPCLGLAMLTSYRLAAQAGGKLFGVTRRYGTPELHDSLDDFIGRFEDHDFLPVGEAHYRVRRHFDLFDQVAIQNNGSVVETGYVNHGYSLSQHIGGH